MKLTSEPFSRELLADWLSLLSDLAASRFADGKPTLLMNSDVAWQLAGSDPKSNIRFWFDGDELVAYAWFQPPYRLIFDCQTSACEALDEVLTWAIGRRQQFPKGTMPFLKVRDMTEWAEVLKEIEVRSLSEHRVLITSVFEHDETTLAKLNQREWRASDHFEPHMFHELPGAEVPAEWTVTAVAETRREEYAAAHRDAWGAGSSFSVQRLQDIAAIGGVFDPELCLAIERDAEFAGTCIFWQDPKARIGNIEPFGVRPKYRGSGAAQALIAGGLERLSTKGMAACRVYTAGFNHQAQGLYRACGFKTVGISRTHYLELDE